VAQGALYRHYVGKNDMARKLLVREVGRFVEGLVPRLLARGAAFESALRDAVAYMCDYYEAEPYRFAFVLLTQHGFPEETLLEPSGNPSEILKRFVRRGQRRGDIRVGDPALFSSLVLGLVLQPLVMHWYRRLAGSPGRLADPIAEACLRLLSARTERLPREGVRRT
jgi:AcrR family transcriptional regulator